MFLVKKRVGVNLKNKYIRKGESLKIILLVYILYKEGGRILIYKGKV